MGAQTGISWTDRTFNPWWGCTKVSPGCDHCYAEQLDARYGGDDTHWGKGARRRVFADKHWNQPLQWNARAARTNLIEKVFCASMADVMDDEAPEGQRDRLWRLIDATPNLFWQLLTKRPQRYVRYLPKQGFKHDNVILMATVESQEFYASRITALYRAAGDLETRNSFTRGANQRVPTGISYEPALGPLSIREYPGLRPDWLIFGGETGAGRRPIQIRWAEDIKDECEEFGIAFFMKQVSAHTPARASALIPSHLLVRQFPDLPAA
jgi:protein gp37